jgi:hypothetical protein
MASFSKKGLRRGLMFIVDRFSTAPSGLTGLTSKL